MSRIFLSHSSKDNAEAVALRNWFEAEGWDDVFLDLDPGRGIAAGERWERALNDAANRCEAVVFLVSRAWLKSDWCLKEFHLAEKLNKQMFGVLIDKLKPEDLPLEVRKTWQVVHLAQGHDHRPYRVVLPDGEERHVTFSQGGLKRLKVGMVKAGLDPRFFVWPPANDPDRPLYRGMRALEAEDAGIFFGREAEVISALDQLRGLRDKAPPRLFVILGASGAGKSSFLRAGLMARLARDDRNFLTLPVVRPERAAITGENGLVAGLESLTRRVGMVATRAGMREVVAGGAEALGQHLEALAKKVRPPKLAGELEVPLPAIVLAIDQAEELFMSDDEGDARTVLELVAGLARQDTVKLLVLFTIRSDAYEQLQAAPVLTGLRQETFSLPPLPRGAYQMVIEGPARRLRESKRALKIEPALTQALLKDIEDGGGKDALPLLAFTLERLYVEHGGDGDLRLSGYRQIGGIRGSIDAAVDRAFKAGDTDPAVPRERDAREGLLRLALIPWLAGVDPDTNTVRRRVARLSEIPETTRPLVRHLIDQRLLATDTNDRGEQTIEPAHEALLRQWGLLKGWLEEDFGSLAVLSGVQRATRDWLSTDKASAWLSHRGTRLEEAEKLSLRTDLMAQLTDDDRRYLALCREAENTARAKERRATNRIRTFAIASSILAVLTGVFAWYGWSQANKATNQAKLAEEQKKLADEKTIEASRQEGLAKKSAREAVVAGERTENLLQIPKAYFMLKSAPMESLATATAATEKLIELGDSINADFSRQFAYFYFDQIVDGAREIPLEQFYSDYTFGQLRFVTPQPKPWWGSNTEIPGETTAPLILVGSANNVGIIDSAGRPAGVPIGDLSFKLFANDAQWVSSSTFALATGTWGTSAEDQQRGQTPPAVNASLQVYDLKGGQIQTLIKNHDAPIVTVAVTSLARQFVLGGDMIGRIIIAASDGKSEAQIVDTGVHRPIIKILPNIEDGKIVLVFGAAPADKPVGSSKSGLDKDHDSQTLFLANKRMTDILGEVSVVWVGRDQGENCAAEIAGDLALCTNHGTLQIWRSFNLPDESAAKTEENKPAIEFSPFQGSTPTDIIAIPGTSNIAVSSTDGRLGLFTRDGMKISELLISRSQSDSGIGKLGYLAAKKLLFGIPFASGPLSWDVADTIDVIKAPRTPNRELDSLIRWSWLERGTFYMPGLIETVSMYKDQTDRELFAQVSADARFAIGVNDQKIVVADATARKIFEIELPYNSLSPDSNLTWSSYNRRNSEIVGGKFCLFDGVDNFDVASELPTQPAARLAMIDLPERKIVFEKLISEKSRVDLLGLINYRQRPACIYSSGPIIKIFGDNFNEPIFNALDFVTSDSGSIEIQDAIVRGNKFFFLLREGVGDSSRSELFQLDTSSGMHPKVLGMFSTPVKLLDVSPNGKKLLLAGSNKDEIQLVDDNLNAVATLPKQLNSESAFRLNDDGSVLRVLTKTEALELPLSLDHLIEVSRSRLAKRAQSNSLRNRQEEGRNCNSTGEWTRCRAILQQAVLEFPADAQLWTLLANATAMPTLEAAMEKAALYDRALALDPFSYTARYNKSMVLWYTGQYEKAVDEYTKILALPENIPGFEGTESFGAADPIVNAVQNATASIVASKRANLILHRAKTLGILGRWIEAVADVSEIQRLERSGAESERILADGLAAMGDDVGALSAYQSALENFRQQPDQGWLFLPEGTEKLKAWKTFKEADLLVSLASIQGKLGKQAEELETRASALKLLDAALAAEDGTDYVRSLAQELRMALTQK